MNQIFNHMIKFMKLFGLLLLAVGCDSSLTGESGMGLNSNLELRLQGFDSSSLSFSETESPTLVFILSGEAERDINFGWTLTQSSGGGLNNDFTSLTGQVTLKESSSTVSLSLPLLDDSVYEGNEVYDLSITNLTETVTVSIPLSQLSILLIDDDPLPAVEFLTTKSAFYEGDGSSPVAVVLDSLSEVELIASYSLGGSASGSGVDYLEESLIAGEISFPAGQTLASIPFDILPNAADDGDKIIDITLLSLAANSLVGVVGVFSAHKLYIIDVNGPLTIYIFQKKPKKAFYDNLDDLQYDVIFNRPIDTGFHDLVAGDFVIEGSAQASVGGLVNGVGQFKDKKYVLDIDSVLGDGTITPTLPPGLLRALGDATNTNNVLVQGDTTIYDVDTPQNPVSWSLSSPSVGAVTSDITPVISGSGINFEESSVVNIYLDSVCSFSIGSAAIVAGAFSVNNISLTGVEAQDGVKDFYGRIVDVANHVSNCQDLSLSYTVFTGAAGTPLVTVNSSTGQSDPSFALPLSFDVVFSEAINPATFDTTDITQNGSATVDTWVLNTADNITWVLTATVVSAEGTVEPAIAANQVQTLATVNNLASTSTDATVTYALPVAPNTPTSFYAASLNGQVALTWDACLGCTYEIYTDTVAGVTLGSTLLASPATNSYAHVGLVNGVLNYYKIRARRNTVGDSLLSAELSAMSYSDVCDLGNVQSLCTINGALLLANNAKLSVTGNLVIANGGDLQSNPGQSVSVIVSGGFTVENGGQVNANFAALLAGALDIQSGGNFTGDVTSLSVGAMTVAGNMTSNIIDSNITNLTVNAGGQILADGRGDAPDTGVGAPGAAVAGGGGGGHGGIGGRNGAADNGGTFHGSATNPATFGSGGGTADDVGGSGGGILKLFVQGALLNDGVISARGTDGGATAGGGAGGSIWIDAGVTNSGGSGQLAGTGSISVAGGNGIYGAFNSSGGGGGGRLALFSKDHDFRGPIDITGGAPGGAGFSGERGTYHQQTTNTDSLCDTGTMGGNNCLLNSTLYLGDGFILSGSNYSMSALASVTGNGSLDLTGDLTLAAGATIVVDGLGHSGNQGPGGAGLNSGGGAGGGHGGPGGNSALVANGGGSYGLLQNPVTYGSGGGSHNNRGGSGGGAFKILVGGTLTNDGVISANALPGQVGGSGGGAGGSIWIDVGITNTGGAGIFTGTGSIESKGGDSVGASFSGNGGGSGGRIAIQADNFNYRGSIDRKGGGGAGGNSQSGGKGSYDLQVTVPDSLCDTGTMGGNNCTLSSTLHLGDAFTLPASNYIITAGGELRGNMILDLTGDLTVNLGAKIIADGEGFSGSQGPGTGGNNSSGGPGGGHGGRGGQSNSAFNGGVSYGSSTSPITYGSGGTTHFARGASGGGAIKIIVQGTLTNDGIISANGDSGAANSGGGGGAGGSIWIDVGITNGGGAGIFSGTGSLSATGGDFGTASFSSPGGGAGGRIAVYNVRHDYRGSLTLQGGSGNGGIASPGTFFQSTTDMDSFCDTGTMGGNNCVLSSALDLGESFVLTGTDLTIDTAGSLKGNITLNLTGDLTLDAGASIVADAYGSRGELGLGLPGAAASGGGGAGHGAVGGKPHGASTGGSVYGSSTSPATLGSGGGNSQAEGGFGGGAIKIVVQGTFTNNGTVSANGVGPGTGGSGGGGAGGSLWIDVGLINAGAGILSGTGSFTAEGGNGRLQNSLHGGGGGGGRIALHSNQFNYRGTVSVMAGASAGRNATSGGRGTYDLQMTNSDSICDTGTMGSSDCLLNGNLYIGDGYSITGTNYTIDTTGALFGDIDLNLTGDLTINAGGIVSADSYGAGAGNGTGTAGTTVNSGGGGGHGGIGGKATDAANGGVTYGALATPVTAGSGGGSAATAGGTGGGIVKLVVQGTLINNGLITARGSDGTFGAGGASGGSIWVDVGLLNAGAGVLTGTGSFVTSGGAGSSGSSKYGGGGSGGRIALHSNDYAYRGVVDVSGGADSGYDSGAGAFGTFYLLTTNVDSVCDSGTMGGNDCLLSSSLTLGDSYTLAGSNYTIDGTGSLKGNFTIDLTGNLTVNAGGKITADGLGHGPALGAGAPGTNGFGGAGGGHGGVGGKSGTAVNGGPAYGNLTNPITYGSGGGGGNPGASGGFGGGALKIVVGGTFTNNGVVSAIGTGAEVFTGTGGGGGGAGGSLWIDVGVTNAGVGILSGSGSFLAFGGDGVVYSILSGGGGGGGRIALHSVAHSFRGVVDVTGGDSDGANSGSGEHGTYYQVTTDTDSFCDSGTMVGNDCLLSSTLHLGNDFTLNGTNYTVDGAGTLKGNLILDLSGDLTINVGGLITADDLGFTGFLGPGAAEYGGTFGGAGGSHAGAGGISSPTAGGGPTYGSLTQPITRGSGGGSINDKPGGIGGGALKILVRGTLTNDGLISAKGGTGFLAAGGGAGGSIWIDVGITNTGGAGAFTGTGSLDVSGGDSSSFSILAGAGGGGGRIAFYSTDYLYRGGIVLNGGAQGGNAKSPGKAGSFYQEITNLDSLCDGATSFATTCTISTTVTVGEGLDISGGSINNLTIDGTGSLTSVVETVNNQIILLGNLQIDLGGSLNLNLKNLELVNATIAGSFNGNVLDSQMTNLTVTSTGFMTANARGHRGSADFSNGYGPGGGIYVNNYKAGGGGYGGIGGDGHSSVSTGGDSYGASLLPIYLGSGGATGHSLSAGGHGGGLLYLNVSNTLTVDGTLAANGGAGTLGGGGGSGGSLWLETATITGAASGLIQAEGGTGGVNGATQYGGGGGGGRIGIYAATDAFTGTGTLSTLGGLAGGGTATDGIGGTVTNSSGSSAHIITATSTLMDGNLGGLAGADAICNSHMRTQGLGGTWKALLSTSTVDASTQITISKAVWNLRSDIDSGPQEVAANLAAFWSGTLAFAAGSYDELGYPLSTDNQTWTGTLATPTAGLKSTDNCSDWTSDVTDGTVGISNAADNTWLEESVEVCSNLHRLYCITQ